MKLLQFVVILLPAIAALPRGQKDGGNLELGAYVNKQNILSDLLTERLKGREEAILEQPTLIERKDSIYDNAQRVVANFLRPKPIVDTISEHEKYGNEGDQFRAIGNVIVGGYEGFSNLLNGAINLPFEAMKEVTRKASSYFSTLGAQLTGL